MSEKLEKLNQEIEKTEAKLRRAQHEEKILEHQIKTLTRKERTHRLCTRGSRYSYDCSFRCNISSTTTSHYAGN